jgi:hypothetical protein
MTTKFLYIVIPRAQLTEARLAEARRLLTDLHSNDEEGREVALAALESYASGDLLNGDCGSITPDPETAIRWYIAGGITDRRCCEDPSEEYTTLCQLDELYDTLLGWAREDGAARIASRR